MGAVVRRRSSPAPNTTCGRSSSSAELAFRRRASATRLTAKDRHALFDLQAGVWQATLRATNVLLGVGVECLADPAGVERPRQTGTAALVDVTAGADLVAEELQDVVVLAAQRVDRRLEVLVHGDVALLADVRVGNVEAVPLALDVRRFRQRPVELLVVVHIYTGRSTPKDTPDHSSDTNGREPASRGRRVVTVLGVRIYVCIGYRCSTHEEARTHPSSWTARGSVRPVRGVDRRGTGYDRVRVTGSTTDVDPQVKDRPQDRSVRNRRGYCLRGRGRTDRRRDRRLSSHRASPGSHEPGSRRSRSRHCDLSRSRTVSRAVAAPRCCRRVRPRARRQPRNC